MMELSHLGMSGLRLVVDGAVLCIDPPQPGAEPAVLTWSEAERVAGAAGRPLAAMPSVMDWLQREGTWLLPGQPVAFAGMSITAVPYTPIPYATVAEGMRKFAIGLRHPSLAAQRLAHTLRRPSTPPVALRIARAGVAIGVLGQALHRFLSPEEAAQLTARFTGCDVLIASPDFDDEVACGALLADIPAGRHILADQIGPVRRLLGLPTRPLQASLASAPPRTCLLPEHGRMSLKLSSRSAV